MYITGIHPRMIHYVSLCNVSICFLCSSASTSVCSPLRDPGCQLPGGFVSPRHESFGGAKSDAQLRFRQGHLGLVGIHRPSRGRDRLSWSSHHISEACDMQKNTSMTKNDQKDGCNSGPDMRQTVPTRQNNNNNYVNNYCRINLNMMSKYEHGINRTDHLRTVMTSLGL